MVLPTGDQELLQGTVGGPSQARLEGTRALGAGNRNGAHRGLPGWRPYAVDPVHVPAREHMFLKSLTEPGRP